MRGSKKERVIAKNPLSQNIAQKLGYYEPNIGPRGFQAILEKTAAEITKRFPMQKITWQAIASWIYARDDDETRAKRQPQIESLDAFAKVIGINSFWELYIPENYKAEFKIDKLSKSKKKIINAILRVEDDELTGTIAYLSAYFQGRKNEHPEKKELYKQLINLLNHN